MGRKRVIIGDGGIEPLGTGFGGTSILQAFSSRPPSAQLVNMKQEKEEEKAGPL
jgi:hypothetical protein